MKSNWFIWLSLLVLVSLCFVSSSAQACPNCFASTSKKVLHTYYLSAVFLSLLPFGVVTFISVWYFRNKRNLSRNKHSTCTSQNVNSN